MTAAPAHRALHGWAVLLLGCALLLAAPAYVVAPTVLAMARGQQPAWLVDPVVRAITQWRIHVPLLCAGMLLSLTGLWLQQRVDRAAGRTGSRVLLTVTVTLVIFGGLLGAGLLIAAMFVLLFV